MKKLILASAIALMMSGAYAQQTTYFAQNDGRISNSVSTYAAVNGNGTSYSVATGSASAESGGAVSVNPIAGGAALTLNGYSNTAAGGVAYNVSTGSGTGSAVSQGWADSRTFGNAGFVNEHGTIALHGSTDSGMDNAVRNGVDYSVVAGTSQDGFASGVANGSFSAGGSTSQLGIAGGATIAANVWDTKASQSYVSAGAVTFTDGVPANQTAALRNSNAGNDTVVNASYVDPVAK